MDPLVDLLVVGGGIHGAAVARDAARRGLTVVLAEKDDLAEGTSSRSSKLVHGGIRYLETGQFALVKEALHERAVLLRIAPHLVTPLPFVIPFHRGERGARPAWLVRTGLELYDRLSGAGASGEAGLPAHRLLGADEALALEPDLPAEGLRGAALFFDARMDDARLVVASAVDAARAGARVLVHTAVTALAPAGGGTWRASLSSGEVVQARLVVNAAGPWADRVRGLSGRGVAAPSLRPTRGSHVVVPALTRGHALLLFAADRRVFFVVPWGAFSLVGTTDVDFAGDPSAVVPAPDDLRLLRGEIERRWPGRGTPVARAFAGLRPLVARGVGAGSALPWRNTREARLVEEEGLLSLVGGKYTTARSFAERAVDRVVARLGAATRVRACDTAVAPLPARPGESTAPAGLDATPAVDEATVRHAVEHEFARRAGDVIWRRTRLWLDRNAARAAAPQVTKWMAPLLGWSESARAAEQRAVEKSCDEEERWLAAAT